jgi:hypothetical protein
MEVSGPSSNQPTYKQEFTQSVKVFEESFKGYQNSTFDPQKKQFALAMNDSLTAMQDSANGMFNKHLGELKDKLSQDVNAYLENPTDANRKKVDSDINSLKNG